MAKKREWEWELIRCLEALHKGEARPISSLFTLVHHNVYSCEPRELPVPVDRDQNKKLYYLMNVTARVTASRGHSRKTPRGRWKSKEGYREVKINGTAHGWKQRFAYVSGEPHGENIKWAMLEYTLYPPKAMENKFALCWVYRTERDGRRNNGRPRNALGSDAPLPSSFWGTLGPICDVPDLDCSNDLLDETYDLLHLDYNGNDFP